MKWFIKVLRHYADFSGRARRKEYWSFVGFNILFAFVLSIIVTIVYTITTDGNNDSQRLFGLISSASGVYNIALLLPAIALTARRMHDLGKSAWMMCIGLIPFVGWIWLFVLVLTEGEQGNNEYGADPKTNPETFSEPARLTSAGVILIVASAVCVLSVITALTTSAIDGYLFVWRFIWAIPTILLFVSGILLLNGKNVREVTEKSKTVPIILLAAAGIVVIVSIIELSIYGIIFNFYILLYTTLYILSYLSLLVLCLLFLTQNRKYIGIATVTMAVCASLWFLLQGLQITMSPTYDGDDIGMILQQLVSRYAILLPIAFIVLAATFYPRKNIPVNNNLDESAPIKNPIIETQPESPQPGKKPVLRSFGKEVKGIYTYEYYAASSAEEARLYLSFCTVTEPNYYIQIETPEGVWGLDKEGLFLAELLPFQKNLSLAQCEGSYGGFSIFNISLAARGMADNFVAEITCGNCNHQWHDGLRVQNKTIVKCPACKKYNSIDTANSRVMFIG